MAFFSLKSTETLLNSRNAFFLDCKDIVNIYSFPVALFFSLAEKVKEKSSFVHNVTQIGNGVY